MNKSELANTVIDRLGGPAVVARLCDIRMPAVCGWRKKGIPRAQLRVLMLLKPKAFEGLEDYLPKRKYPMEAPKLGRPFNKIEESACESTSPAL